MSPGSAEDDEPPTERGLARAATRIRAVIISFVILPTLTALLVWLWIHHERGKIRDRGFVACVSSGREASWCEAAASKNHARCMELTFRPGTRTSGSSFDEHGYIECLDIGDRAYWALSARRAAERRRQGAR